MRIFVTGATGYIGSAIVCELLGVGHEIVGLARSDASAAAGGVIHTGFNTIAETTHMVPSSHTDPRAVEAIGAARNGTGKPLAVILVSLARTPGRLRTEDDKTGFMPSLIGHCPRQGRVSVRPRWIEPLARPTTAFC